MTGRGNQVRVFVALDLTPNDKVRLTDTITHLQQSIASGVRWVDPQGIHLTLKFLGNIDAGLVDGVQQAMSRASRDSRRFGLSLSELGVFPNDREPRVLWAGVSGDLDSLGTIQMRVEEELSQLGFPRERRPFSPHLTLGRVRDGVSTNQRNHVGRTMSSTPLPPGDVWEVTEIHLIRSTLTPQGARYTSMGSQPLGVPYE
jgi:2'-5' RNA ligase